MSERIEYEPLELNRREPTEEERIAWEEEMHMDLPDGTYFDIDKNYLVFPDAGDLPIQTC